MSAAKKAACLAPRSVIAACQRCIEVMEVRSSAAGYARLIADGIARLARTDQVTQKLIDLCREKYPKLDREISAHIPTSARKQARHLKRAKTFGSLRDVRLEALLVALVERGLMTSELEVTHPGVAPAAQHRRAA